MSWLARSIANTLNLNEDDPHPSSSSPPPSPRGVKDDLSELTHSLTRQFWGVASFLSPPPPQTPPNDEDDDEEDDVSISGIRSDLSELGGKLKSGISKISETINVSEFTKMASDFISFAADNQEEGEGVTEEVVEFVEQLAMRPQNWLEFPLPQQGEDEDGSNS